MGKLSQLLEVSDPKQVILNAQKYFNDANVKVLFKPRKK